MGYSGGSFGVAHKPHNRQCLTTYSAASISSSAIASFRSVATRLVRHAFVPSGSFLLACDSRKRLSDRARTRSAGFDLIPEKFTSAPTVEFTPPESENPTGHDTKVTGNYFSEHGESSANFRFGRSSSRHRIQVVFGLASDAPNIRTIERARAFMAPAPAKSPKRLSRAEARP